MNIDAAGLAFIEANEGYTPFPINDNGHPMWGYGHDRQAGEAAPVAGINQADAETLLEKDLATRFEPAVNQLIPPECTQNQYNALCDFAYNLGVTAFATMMHHGWGQVPLQIPAWCWEHVDGVLQKSPGLETRRAAEVALFNK